MKQLLMVAVLGFACASCGGGIDSFEDAMEAQASLADEMVEVLEGVTDEKSAQAAVPAIEVIGERMAELAAQTQGLPVPEPEEWQAIGEKMAVRAEESQQQMMAQMMKLDEYPALNEAFQNAIVNAR